MNKNDLIDTVAKNPELKCESKTQAERMVKAVIDGLTAGLRDSSDHKVQIVGFGTFSVRERKARTGRNPQTGEAMKIAASRTVGFTPGQGLKDLVNAGGKKKK